ncbi:hypothetical protein F7R23_17320 [Burkholderia diffusa]|nr:hypothetical protein F7R23_17320 [Burkholderia diffusa]
MRTTRSIRSISKACSTAATSASARLTARARDALTAACRHKRRPPLPGFDRMPGRCLFYGPRFARRHPVQT